MNMEKMKEVFSDEEFVKSLFELETPEEVQAALKEKEIELSTDEICQMRDFLSRYQEGTLTEEEKKAVELAGKYGEGELSEEELENVSGGGVVLAMAFLISVCVTVGLLVGAEVTDNCTRGRW